MDATIITKLKLDTQQHTELVGFYETRLDACIKREAAIKLELQQLKTDADNYKYVLAQLRHGKLDEAHYVKIKQEPTASKEDVLTKTINVRKATKKAAALNRKQQTYESNSIGRVIMPYLRQRLEPCSLEDLMYALAENKEFAKFDEKDLKSRVSSWYTQARRVGLVATLQPLTGDKRTTRYVTQRWADYPENMAGKWQIKKESKTKHYNK